MANEDQEMELEALRSIYEGDDHFKELSLNIFQYRVGDSGSLDSFVVEVQWGEGYPESEPHICLGAFYNHHLSPATKEKICGLLRAEASLSPGSAVTFSVFEAAKEAYTKMAAGDWAGGGGGGVTQEAKTAPVEKVKKEQLTKSQKRRLINTTDHKGEKIRGWDWIDVIKHLSRTGGKDD